jgi:hypothetical protein
VTGADREAGRALSRARQHRIRVAIEAKFLRPGI